jgi:hypothetical protein
MFLCTSSAASKFMEIPVALRAFKFITHIQGFSNILLFTLTQKGSSPNASIIILFTLNT